MSHLSLSLSSSRQAGFSLVEILLVILIILMLAGALIVYVLPEQGKAQISTTKLKLESMKSGLQRFKLDMGTYPRPEHGGLKALLEKPKLENSKKKGDWDGPYVDLSTTFDDAWGQDLKFKLVNASLRTKGSAIPYLLYSIGPDGKDNTEDDIYLYKPKKEGLGSEFDTGDGGGTGSLDGLGGGGRTPRTGTGGAGTTPTPPGS
jgi:general secretion pathway protein G